ncbi:MAG: hypothetical protein IPG89_05990 [Bacteroidetes bacterium]|nr:hypothetical protein [Bacteroidota bacterium]
MKKITFNFLMPALACALIFTSCGNKNEANGETAASDSTKTEEPAKVEEPTVDFATACTMENKMAVTVKGYEYDTDNKKPINFDIADFVVKNSTWNLKTDSTAELSLFNYTAEEATPKQKNDQVEIRVSFIARKGKKIGPGVYNHSDSQADITAITNVITNNGKVYFNWSAGMPDVGTVTLSCANKDGVCGEFKLASDSPETKWIGTVKVNGTFKVEAK